MRIALEEAQLAYDEGEVPVGAVVVCEDRVVARAHNRIEQLHDASAHAELLALRSAAAELNTWRLTDCVIYVTLEPCAMCMGAMLNFRVGAIAFGAFDETAGCCISKCELSNGITNITIPYSGGIMAEECSNIIKNFFERRRVCQ
ncbi:MAG: nucleoside deaminase [Christensenellaceae bacterium]|nr:nucleoside deaminase [Christensenellaceae bacterium]